MRKRIYAGIATLLTSMMLLALSASPAAAETIMAVDADWNTDYPKACVSQYQVLAKMDGCFQPQGDIFWIRDKSADGYSVRLNWVLETGEGGTCWDQLGAAKAWAICDRDFPEGQMIKFAVQWNSPSGWQSAGIVVGGSYPPLVT